MRAYPPTTYDLVPYESGVFAQSHPDRLATIATLLGMKPVQVTASRVLEIGCAGGGNLIPMAVSLPGSTFVGIDLSARQIETARQFADSAAVKNIEFKHLDIRDVGPDLGSFDYIVCHGVYSWVNREAQDKILQVCSQNLSPRGVAYVSYNTYPGWHMRGIVRDAMLYHARQFAEPGVRVKQARNLLDFLAKSVTQKDDPYSLLLKSELEMVQKCRDAYLFHDHLEDENNPVYFHQFAERAAEQGLQYLGEVDFRVMLAGNYPPEVQSVLQVLSPDAIHLEQYMDFLRNRMFRQTLLCHQGIPLVHQVRAEVLNGLYVASAAQPAGGKSNVQSTEVEKFQAPGGSAVSTGQPIFKAALAHLARVWPQAVPFDVLRTEARAAVGGDVTTTAAQDARVLAEGLLNCYASASGSLIEFHVRELPFVLRAGDRPVASALARVQSASGARVTNLRHESVTLNAVDRLLVPYLDGTRNHAALAETVADLVKKGNYSVKHQGQPVTDPNQIRRIAGPLLSERLAFLGRSALLVQ